MRVCVIGTRGFPYIEGGVEKHCELLYPLFGEKFDVTVFRRKPYVKSKTNYEKIKFIDLPSTKIKGVEAVLHSFLATMYSIIIRPDVVHFHNIGPAMFAPILKLFSIPVVLTYHSPNYEHTKWSPFARKILLFSERLALKYSDRIIFVNRFQMEKYPEKIRNKSIYIPNGIKEPIFSNGTDFLNKIHVEKGKYILSVGRITPEKGFDILIKAFYQANAEEYKLVIAGGVEFESAYMHELETLCNDSRVVFTGAVYGEDLAQLYSNAALYVLASNNEGFPLVLLEAMSYKRDVLVSDIPATHLIELPMENYFPKGDFEVLTEKINFKLQNSQEYEYDLKGFEWIQIAIKTTDVMEQII